MSQTPQQPKENDPWETGTFEGNRRHQLLEDSKLSFAEKIKWVEEAQRIAEMFDKARPHAKPLFLKAKP